MAKYSFNNCYIHVVQDGLDNSCSLIFIYILGSEGSHILCQVFLKVNLFFELCGNEQCKDPFIY